jgi:hypothetical protein
MDGIRFVDWPANSPDLHRIEQCIGGFRDILGDQGDWQHVGSARKEVRDKYAEKISEIWAGEEMTDKIELFATEDAWLKVAEQCIENEGDNNNFHG